MTPLDSNTNGAAIIATSRNLPSEHHAMGEIVGVDSGERSQTNANLPGGTTAVDIAKSDSVQSLPASMP